MMKGWRRRVAASLLALGCLFGTVSPGAAELSLVTGALWSASSVDEKRAYLIGVANTVAVARYVAAKRSGADPASMSARMSEALSLESIDNAIVKIDQWYKDNPSRVDFPVLGVVWQALVKAKARR
jgi:hypothetical protein